MNIFKSTVVGLALSLVVIALPAIASAQYGGYGNGGYGGYGNGRYGNGRYGNGGYYGGDIQNVVRDLKQRAKSFERITDNRDNRGGYYRDNIEDLADQFAKAADRFEDKFGRGRNLDNSADAARRVLDLGNQIERSLGYSRYPGYLDNHWDPIANDLRIIADVYGMNYNDGYYRNNRNNRNYPRRNRNNRQLPSWWPF
ncbi:MAG: hypothetical protein UZ17_ACD001002811 [Acidobacteria bacterium OLB17]|nr:MAG: hypothetical protein UZ17_ACD001002811 [Acidobacteria bacterium OLB17]MCZ2391168.1 hypothetical protein [Acidobacteriota bacterium]